MTNGKEFLEWYKCPVHNTWMQPAFTPFKHWACAVAGCDRVRAAKMRTAIERKIFAEFNWMQEHA